MHQPLVAEQQLGRGAVEADHQQLHGSSDLFPDDRFHALRPFQSVNYIASHDGFTLYDLVSYNQKRNWPNGHDNTDGERDGSWNCGWEGDDEAPFSEDLPATECRVWQIGESENAHSILRSVRKSLSSSRADV